MAEERESGCRWELEEQFLVDSGLRPFLNEAPAVDG